jgi:hypothetical protein
MVEEVLNSAGQLGLDIADICVKGSDVEAGTLRAIRHRQPHRRRQHDRLVLEAGGT